MHEGFAVGEYSAAAARWPANVILTDPIFDGDVPGVVGGGETGPSTVGERWARVGDDWGMQGNGEPIGYGDSGTYSRFFLIPKASRADREPPGKSGKRRNTHPTVKPLELMRHLVRLVTPPGGVVLDPFLGSGTTALACKHERFRCIGIELDPESCEIAKARLTAQWDAHEPEPVAAPPDEGLWA